MSRRLGRLLFLFAIPVLAACGADEPEQPPPVTRIQREALLTLFALPAKDFGGNSGERASAAPAYQASSTVNCTPQQLTPPVDCPNGGNIYYTINLGCTGPSLCCGNEPPCQEDRFAIGGLGTATYNNCKTISDDGDRIIVNGAIRIGIEAETNFTCSGIYRSEALVRITGMPTVQINGREACPGTISLEARAKLNTESVTTINGRVCGVDVSELYADGCVVGCGGGTCCPGGSYCSNCGTGCIPEGYVDCCNGKHCPPGTQCTADGSACML